MSETVLVTPKGYDRDKKCNGCGSGWNSKLVPDRIYFLNINRACCIHDYMYEVGITKFEKEVADEVLLLNLNRLINEDTNWIRNNSFVKRRMKNIAKIYYKFVVEFGNDAFFNGKEKK